MSFLLDTDTCSAHLKRPAGLIHWFVQYSGRLFIPAVALGELCAWAYRRKQPLPLLQQIGDLLADLPVIDFDAACAQMFGRNRGVLEQKGISVPTTDLMIASVALVHDLTLVTHNTADYRNIPGLRLDDWLAS
jgi:tRNA(fMet)-specific endonuclease VapC